MNKNDLVIRGVSSNLEIRQETEDKIIAGYFIVFNRETELWPGAYEEIAPEALNNTMENDIRALINHDTSKVLARNKAGTLNMKIDSTGLYGEIVVNPKDTEAVNLYERVKRGDVSQCSFGFNILDEDVKHREDGTVKWTLTDIDLHEISVCTFPAYSDTNVQARHDEVEQYKQRQKEKWRMDMKGRLNNGS